MTRDEDEVCATLARQLEEKATELEARRRGRELVALQVARRDRDESARRALRSLDELARWRTRIAARAQRLRDGEESLQPLHTSVLKATFRVLLIGWLFDALCSEVVRFPVVLAPLAALWIALLVELRR